MPVTSIIVMGVSGCGKSTIGRGLAEALHWPFRDGDEFHPPANVAKMSAGTPLTDADRWPWLDRIGDFIDQTTASHAHAVIACSALKRSYRDRLSAGGRAVHFAHLQGTFDLIAGRMAARRDHFMPTTLLKSQFATLEPLSPDERAIIVDITQPPQAIIADIVSALQLTC
ncbi:MAG: gluconokinase [Alphaproteobacteria bacterium]